MIHIDFKNENFDVRTIIVETHVENSITICQTFFGIKFDAVEQ